MNLGNITVITSPDVIFNDNLSYLLVKPSLHIKHQFQTILSECFGDINVFIYDDSDTDLAWLLSRAHHADVIIVDIDNCDPITKQFITLILTRPNTHYITSDEVTPYGIISRNRIYNLDLIVEQLLGASDEDDDEEAEEE